MPVVAYHPSFERRVLKGLAEFRPDSATPLLELRDRVVDLLPIVRDYVYHPAFGGKFGLKASYPPSRASPTTTSRSAMRAWHRRLSCGCCSTLRRMRSTSACGTTSSHTASAIRGGWSCSCAVCVSLRREGLSCRFRVRQLGKLRSVRSSRSTGPACPRPPTTLPVLRTRPIVVPVRDILDGVVGSMTGVRLVGWIPRRSPGPA